MGTDMHGHNSSVGGIAVEKLRSYIERWEKLDEEKRAIGGDQKDLMSMAKADGFDIPTLKNIIKLRKKEPNEIEEQENLLDIYRRALGMG